MKNFIIYLVMGIAALFAALTANAQTEKAENDSISLDSIGSYYELEEIVVKGTLPNTRMKGDALVTKISGSTLE